MNYTRINTQGCAGTCNQGRAACDCRPMPAEACSDFLSPEPDKYEGELFPRFVRWIDENPKKAQAACLAFLLAVLAVGAFIDGAPL